MPVTVPPARSVRDATLRRRRNRRRAQLFVRAGTSRATVNGDLVAVEVDGRLYRVRVLDGIAGGRTAQVSGAKRDGSRTKRRVATVRGNDVLSPMHGVVVELTAGAGDSVAEGQSSPSSRR